MMRLLRGALLLVLATVALLSAGSPAVAAAGAPLPSSVVAGLLMPVDPGEPPGRELTAEEIAEMARASAAAKKAREEAEADEKRKAAIQKRCNELAIEKSHSPEVAAHIAAGGDAACTGDPDKPCSLDNPHLGCTEEEIEQKECDEGKFWNPVEKFLKQWSCTMRQTTVNMMQNTVAIWTDEPEPTSTTAQTYTRPSGKPAQVTSDGTAHNVDPTTQFVQKALYPAAMLVALAGVLWQAILLIITRRAEPVVDILRGLFTTVLWVGVGLSGPSVAAGIADAFTEWILYVFNEPNGDKAAGMMMEISFVGSVAGAIGDTIVTLVMFCVIWVVALVQWLIFLWRDAGILLLSGATILAAAGSFTASTRQWLPKLLANLLALIVYKPVAILLFCAAGVMYETGGTSLGNWLMGVMMMIASIVALPTLMKMFSWATGSVGAGGLQAAGNAATTYALYGRDR